MSETLLLFNGRIRHASHSAGIAEAMVIVEGKIAAIGSLDEARAAAGREVREHDLEGATLLPSFRDALGCLTRETLARSQVDLSKESTISEIFAVVERFAKALPQERWIVGYGWNKGQWGWTRFPHRADLDLVSPHHPVVLFSSDQRVAWLNSSAMGLLGINKATPNPPGGVIERDIATHAATGILKERATDLVADLLPLPPAKRLQESLRECARAYLRKGITHVDSHDTTLGRTLLTEAVAEEDLALKVRTLLRYSDWKKSNEAEIPLPQSERVAAQGVWMETDGTLASQTAWMLEPYVEDWNHFGLEILSEKEIETILLDCLETGTTPTFHTSGDAALRSLLKAIEATGFSQRVWLVHGDLIDTGERERLAGKNLGLIVNPYRLLSEREVGLHQWGERWHRAIDLPAWTEAGVELAFGSGVPLNRWSPLASLAAAVHPSEESPGRPTLTLQEGLAALIRKPANESRDREDGILLEVGQEADLVVLAEDPLAVDSKNISRIGVLGTLLDGEWVYRSEKELETSPQ
jgi:predicted amidohydrolase YtcJ